MIIIIHDNYLEMMSDLLGQHLLRGPTALKKVIRLKLVFIFQ
jgi:hypothetical protein